MPEPGDEAPRFTLPDAEFRPFALKAFRGRPVLLVFFPAAFSPACTQRVLELQRRLAGLDAMHVQVAGVSVDGPYALRAFASACRLAFPLLSDFHRETTRLYGLEDDNFLGLRGVSRPAVFLIDPDGVVQYRWVADRHGVHPDYDELLRTAKAMSG